ncbi:MAG: hypothetical protein K0S39_1790 [Paenibacillus sp.]|jgi:hypothetical protein|nr:hypothetical protein [Paenibacillus sp.]
MNSRVVPLRVLVQKCHYLSERFSSKGEVGPHGKLEKEFMAPMGGMLCHIGELYNGCSIFAAFSYTYRS